MDKMSLREAVKHFDVSRPTLQKALKTGKVSGVQDGKGHWQVDPAELSRVFKARGSEVESEHGKLSTTNTTEITALRAELENERIRRDDDGQPESGQKVFDYEKFSCISTKKTADKKPAVYAWHGLLVMCFAL